MKIQKTPVLACCLLLYAGLASAQAPFTCSGPLYRSADPLLLNEVSSKKLQIADEASSLDFSNWSSKGSIEQVLKQHRDASSFHAQVMVLIDCNGKASDAKFLQSSSPSLAQQLLPLINGSTGNRIAKAKGLAVSGYAVIHLMNENGHLIQNQLFVNQ
jgi:hypothetical protein